VWEETQLILTPETVTLAQVLLYLGQNRMQADLLALIALSLRVSVPIHMSPNTVNSELMARIG